jgi:copper transport protein
VAFAIAVALIPQVVYAHAQLVQSDPAADALLESTPATVTLIFSEPVTPAGPGIRVFSPSGRQIAATVTVRGSVLTAGIESTEAGTYIVSWQVFAADTHPSRGSFKFVVGRPSANPYAALLDIPVAGTATPIGLALQAIARWVHFVGFALAFGVVAYGVLTRREGGFNRLVGAGVVLLIAAEPIALLGQLASLSFDGDTVIAVLGSSFGRIAGLRLGAALLVWTLMATARSWPLLAIGGVVAVLDGAAAHAIPGLPGAGQLLVAIHVAAMGLWLGGLVAFLGAPDRVFGRYAAITLAIAVASGFVLGLAHTNFGTALLTTDYGRVLMVKVLVVGAALAAAALRRYRTEFALGMAAVACATLVAALPPPN